jgi:hypothetical protein
MPELTVEQYNELTPPNGWRWTTRPRQQPGAPAPGAPVPWAWGQLSIVLATLNDFQATEAALVAIYRWANDNCIQLSIYNQHIFFDRPTRRENRFTVPKSFYARPMAEAALRIHNPGQFVNDQSIVPLGLLRIPDSDVLLFCNNCLSGGRPMILDGNTFSCNACFHRCYAPTCEILVSTRFDGCPLHQTRAICQECDDETSLDYVVNAGNRQLCENCAENACRDCGVVGRELFWDGIDEDEFDDEVRICADCQAERRRRPNMRAETFDDEAEMSAEQLALSSTDYRPIRTCSIEMETADGGQSLAPLLYAAQLSPYNQRIEYHHGREGFCYVERDASLGRTGGELIFDRIELDNKDDLEKLAMALAIVRKEVKEGRVVMDMRCGLHIHVDAHQCCAIYAT